MQNGFASGTVSKHKLLYDADDTKLKLLMGLFLIVEISSNNSCIYGVFPVFIFIYLFFVIVDVPYLYVLKNFLISELLIVSNSIIILTAFVFGWAFK